MVKVKNVLSKLNLKFELGVVNGNLGKGSYICLLEVITVNFGVY